MTQDQIEAARAAKKKLCNELVARFKGLMPKMTDEQLVDVRDMLMASQDRDLEPRTVNGAATCRAWEKLKEYVNEHEDFNIASVRLAIFASEGNVNRTAEQLKEYRRLGQEIEEQWAHIDSVIDGLNDDLLERARQIAMVHADFPEWARKFYEHANARDPKHRFLRGEMFKRLECGDVSLQETAEAGGIQS